MECCRRLQILLAIAKSFRWKSNSCSSGLNTLCMKSSLYLESCCSLFRFIFWLPVDFWPWNGITRLATLLCDVSLFKSGFSVERNLELLLTKVDVWIFRLEEVFGRMWLELIYINIYLHRSFFWRWIGTNNWNFIYLSYFRITFDLFDRFLLDLVSLVVGYLIFL